jgi:transposase-like protein
MRYKAKQKQEALKMWLVDGESIVKVCHKFECTERTLWRWKSRYDGTKESLQNRYCRPHTPDKKMHTQNETADILRMHELYPNAHFMELHGRLRAECAYSRSYWGLRHFIITNELFNMVGEHIKRVPQPYDTPTMLGVKMQMDIKYVPTECLKGKAKADYWRDGVRLYQYTMIDECTREVFEYCFNEQNGWNTREFVRRAIIFFGYVPKEIQTDNGLMFRNPPGSRVKHIFDIECERLGIFHHLIQAYTPRHNGKVERQHRKDQERNYNLNTFGSVKELNDFLKGYICDNNEVIPNSMLRSRHKKSRMLTPAQKRAECLEVLREEQQMNSVRWLPNRMPA